MVIGFDGSRAFLKERTGTENYSYQLLKALSKIDSNHNYIVYIRPSFINSAIAEIMNGFPGNFEFKTIGWPRLWTQVGLAKQTFKDKMDVLFVPAHTPPLIHKKGLKTVVTVHDLGAEYLPVMHQIKQRLYLKWITHFQLKSATKIIAVSKATKEDLIKKVGINPGKIEVVYEGYDKELFNPVKIDILINSLKKFDLVSGEYFLFVGTVQPRKNLERLIRAFSSIRLPRPAIGGARNDRVRLAIVGSKGWLSNDIYKLPKKLGIKDKVKFLGRVEEKDLPALYCGAIALTFPSLFEGFGLPILEAQACGCPVLTSNVSSMPEVGGKGAMYVNPYSLDDIIRGMTEIRNSKFEIRNLINAGFENVKRFSWEKCARETLGVLEDTI